MTHLRQIMLEELERRNYAQSTIRAYIRTVERFARHFHCPPDRLGPEHIRQYQAAMFRTWKLAPNTVTQRLAALRFLYIQVLKRGWSVAETPYPKKVLHLPEILSQQEVARLIDATETPFQRILVMTLYATGARRAEVAHLKVSDIDSERMVVHIRGGKGRKDRAVMLSAALLAELRIYWRGLRRKPTLWLFPGNRWHTSNHPVSTKVRRMSASLNYLFPRGSGTARSVRNSLKVAGGPALTEVEASLGGTLLEDLSGSDF